MHPSGTFMTDATPRTRRERRLAEQAPAADQPALTRKQLRERAAPPREGRHEQQPVLTRKDLRERQSLARAAEPAVSDIDEMFAAASSFVPPALPPAGLVMHAAPAPAPVLVADPELEPEPTRDPEQELVFLVPAEVEPPAAIVDEPAPASVEATYPPAPATSSAANRIILAGYEGTEETTAEQVTPAPGRRLFRRSPAGVPRTKSRARKHWTRALLRLLVIVVASVIIAAGIKAFVLRTFTVTSDSMSPTLITGERLAVEMLSPHISPYATGDVVVFADPDDWLMDGDTPAPTPTLMSFLGFTPDSSGYLVKRIIGVPGDTVEGLADGTILLNGELLEEKYRQEGTQDPFVYTLGADQYWVMGDNRPVSADSRMHGPLDGDAITGRVWFAFYPLDRVGFIG